MNTRLRGLLQLLASGTVFGIGLWWFMAEQAAGSNSSAHQLAFYGLLVPGGFALAGLVQAVSGVPFAQLSDKWNSLKGWQRGVYGVGIFVLSGVVVFGSLLAYALYGT
jgi:uncharacterized membrane protein YagU involved in acid resistance